MKVHTVLAAHSDLFPEVNFYQFDQFCLTSKLVDYEFRAQDVSKIYSQSNHELPLNRSQFL